MSYLVVIMFNTAIIRQFITVVMSYIMIIIMLFYEIIKPYVIYWYCNIIILI